MTNPIDGRIVAFPEAYPDHTFTVIDGEAGLYRNTGGGEAIQVNHDATPWEYVDGNAIDPDGWGKYVPTDEEIAEAVAQCKVEVLADMGTAQSSQSKRMPMNVRSFSELHDYVDANEYASFCDPESPRANWDTEALNRMQDLVHRWLAHGYAYVERVQMPARVDNTNCLAGVRCPVCGYEEGVEVQAKVWTAVIDNGTDEHGDTIFTDETPAMCGDTECQHEATFGEFLIANQQKNARPRVPWMTLGELRRRTAHLPDETPITADAQGVHDGLNSSWYNISMEDSDIPRTHPPEGDGNYSILLNLLDDFDTRQW